MANQSLRKRFGTECYLQLMKSEYNFEITPYDCNASFQVVCF